ncbi:hypothetical protein AUEXF2481DRAFT_42626 [Aureobasidium subglaciale EXF-2481]|uniref:F-box domain-containing protein n=1 Tax=Aureobasidium subglaciale (strain EXF-2481) TaxID=1043005 RepID=A0A074YFQ6_AURSE|nr:uncharacterized protein AUEXF2481DRAFT_42626 [Aureobasidium subglaciale EXF-2481]KEQ92927.1 hypothetical protein AUEXF2481DRAFT_42626 [Aureobasidium subglaciale EXF-2481]
MAYAVNDEGNSDPTGYSGRIEMSTPSSQDDQIWSSLSSSLLREVPHSSLYSFVPPLTPYSEAPSGDHRKPFRFLALPPELRNRIYGIHLEKGGHHNLCWSQVIYLVGVDLLRCCRQIYLEAARYVNHKRWWVVLKSRTDFPSWDWIYNHVVFEERGILQRLNGRTLASIVNLTLDVTVLTDNMLTTAQPPPITLDNMHRLRRVRMLVDLRLCSFDRPFGGSQLESSIHRWVSMSCSMYLRHTVAMRVYAHHRCRVSYAQLPCRLPTTTVNVCL